MSGGYLYLPAGHQAANLNVNSTSFTVGAIPGTNNLAGCVFSYPRSTSQKTVRTVRPN